MANGDRLKTFRETIGANQGDFAQILGVAPSFISGIERNAKAISRDLIERLLNKYEININWLLTGEGAMLRTAQNLPPAEAERGIAKASEGFKVPLLRQKVSCGPGVDWETSDNVEEYIDIFSILPRLATGRMYAFKASGSSMLGAGIRSGDYLIFDAELGFIPKDDIYVFTLDGEVYCKRLEFDMLANKIKIYSVRVADLEKAELVRTLDMTEASYGDRFRIFGRVRYLLRPNRGED
jgi:SOS-response transcriptional repressor LexA